MERPVEHDGYGPGSARLPLEVAGAEARRTFEEFFERERVRLYRALYLLTGDGFDAEEIMQDAFLGVWSKWERVGRMEDPTGYLYRCSMNAFRSRSRRAARAARRILGLRPGEVPFVLAYGASEDPFRTADDRDALVRAIRALTPRQRAALILIDLLDRSSAEAARALGVREATVRSLASQARAALRSSMGARDG